jgi:hypothetical protein
MFSFLKVDKLVDWVKKQSEAMKMRRKKIDEIF